MSQIRIAKASDVAAFPASTFIVDGTPPIAQCQESDIFNPDCGWTQGQSIVRDFVNLDQITVVGKKCTIIGSAADDGTYDILAQTDTTVTINHTFAAADDEATADLHDAGQAYLTRDQASFIRFIEDQGKAHTTKGGQLYTDLTDPPMDDACSDTWNPD